MADLGRRPETQEIAVQKVIRLLQYLSKLASLRSKIVRAIGEYDHVLWTSTIPHEFGCFTRAWGPDEEREKDIWLEVQHAREPALPVFPSLCKDWVNQSTIRNKNDLPVLLEKISRLVPNPAWREGSDEAPEASVYEHLADNTDIQAAWDRYVEQKWLPWTEEHNTWEKVNKVYSQLFTIHQAQLRLGEEYELVLGVGLLIWQTPEGQRVQRHLVVADASLEFEAKLGKFTVRPGARGAKLRPELDMLDMKEQPTGAEEIAQTALSSADDDPWDKSCVEGVLQALVHSISSQGEYINSDSTKSSRASSKPVVEFAPAVILRKRSSRGLIETLQRIKKQIEDGGAVPDEFLNLAEARLTTETEKTTSSDVKATEFDGEVFFPKPSNDEQRQIVDKIRAANGVLVQGPPGTGKSHTIANLICHLLATGKRILVTAKTPRALQVLEKLLPKELQPLCVNLLGTGLEEQRALESSIGGILRENAGWNEPQSTRERNELEERLRDLRAEQSTVTRRLRDIRESETHAQSIADGSYRGTAARIAEAVNRDRKRFDWFTDTVQLHQSCPVSADDVLRILTALREFTPDKRAELARVSPTETLVPEYFEELVRSEARASKEEKESATGADDHLVSQLAKSDIVIIEGMHDAFAALEGARLRLPTTTQPWLRDAVRDVVTGGAASWRELLRTTLLAISSAESVAAVADDTKVMFPDHIDVRRLHDDTRELQRHVKAGGRLGWGPFRPKLVKERLYVLNAVTVNGRACSTAEHFSALSSSLRARIACEKAWRFWEGRHKAVDGPYRLQLAALKSLRELLASALSIEKRVDKCREELRRCPSIGDPSWADEARISRIVSSCRLAAAHIRTKLATEQIQGLEGPIHEIACTRNAHPIVSDLLDAIRDRNVAEFARCATAITRLEAQRQQVSEADERLLDLQQVLPRLSDDMERTANDARWNEHLRHICEAWHWSQARYWIEDHIRKEDAPALEVRLKQIEHGISDTLALLASLRAWSLCFSRMEESHRRHMTAWQQSMSKLGKGTGKHAWKHRRDAQEHLNACHEVVPAWVMPLHRVWDTVNPAPGMFEVVIVDEASQCGFEALPLFYLGKKVLIVGDDKQISPEAVGIDRDVVTSLSQQYLADFEFRSTFGIENSLFDQGQIRYATSRVTLREHFRCMPEIIRFSNDLCYSSTPLIPLRQYGPDRLPPLEHVFVEGGYREGANSRTINRPEAEAIVERIYDMCCDDVYVDKTMGVVVLQGEAQAQLIESLLLEQLGAEEMEKRRLICGNPYSFQGDERNIMFLSLVAAPNMRIGPLSKPSDERRFNVAASRAQDMMILFHSVDTNDLSAHDLRRTLLEFFQNTHPQQVAGIEREELERHAAQDNRGVVSAPHPFDSWFEVDVALELLRKQYAVLPQFEVAGKRIDLVVEGGRARLAIECDGDHWHGVDRYADDMQRQRQLERCGWEFFRIRESAFYADKDQALSRLWEMLEERGIHPDRRGDQSPPESETNGGNDDVYAAESAPERGESDASESSSLENEEGSSPTSNRRVEDITTAAIERAVLQALSKCSNHTCTVRSITARVLKEIGVLTRGRPREAFELRVMRCVSSLEKNGQVQAYKSKNQRLRLAPRD